MFYKVEFEMADKTTQEVKVDANDYDDAYFFAKHQLPFDEVEFVKFANVVEL